MPAIVREWAMGYLGTISVLGLGFSARALLARALPVTELGILLSGQAVVGLALSMAQLSLPDTVVRFVGLDANENAARAKGSVVRALGLSTLGSGALAFGVALAAGWIANTLYRQTALAGVLVLLAIAMPFTTVGDVLAAAHRGLGQLWVRVVCVDLARALWVILAVFWLMSRDSNTLLTVAAGYGTGAVLSMLLTVGVFWHSARWHVPAARVRAGELLGYSLPLLAAGLLAGPIVSTGLPLLLGSLGSVDAVAFYTVAVALQVFVYLPTAALEQAAVPIWSGQIGAGAASRLCSSYASLTRWSYLAGSVMFVLLFFNAHTALSLLYGPQYGVAAPAVQVSATAALFGVAMGPNEGMLRAIGNTRWIFWTRMVSAVSALGAGGLLIPRWGLMGGVMAVVISSVLINGLYGAGLFCWHGMHPLDGSYAKTLGASVIGFLFVGLALPYLDDGLVRMVLSTGLYSVLVTAMLVALGAFTSLSGAYQETKRLFRGVTRR